MMLYELFGTKAPIVTEETLVDLIKTTDWKYEFSEDERRHVSGKQAMDRLETLIYDFYKKEPERAVWIWNTHAPVGTPDKTVVPEFIIRRELFDV